MQKLNLHQIAVLYLFAFNAGEAGQPNEPLQIAGLDYLLILNDHTRCREYIPDEDGAPINDTQETYDAYNKYIANNEDIDWEDLEHGLNGTVAAFLALENPTPEAIYELIKTYTI